MDSWQAAHQIRKRLQDRVHSSGLAEKVFGTVVVTTDPEKQVAETAVLPFVVIAFSDGEGDERTAGTRQCSQPPYTSSGRKR